MTLYISVKENCCLIDPNIYRGKLFMKKITLDTGLFLFFPKKMIVFRLKIKTKIK